MLDQRLLPTSEIYHTYTDVNEVAQAIQTMVVRGAPAIGVAAALGVALGALKSQAKNWENFWDELLSISQLIRSTRPTAVNLFWAVERMLNCAKAHQHLQIAALQAVLLDEAQKILQEDIVINKQLGEHGQALIDDGDNVLTHCNAGALATAGFGTALGVIYAAQKHGKKIHVFADETRPFLQGARLTAWELQKNNVDVTLITDNMAGWLMKLGRVNKVVVGADRIAANGDTANKIGTYSVAVLAREHGIPFYVAAPLSTIDFKTLTGEAIVIEERDPRELTHLLGTPAAGTSIAPEGIKVFNPAFDVTPSRLITGIITEKGLVSPNNLAALLPHP